MLEKKKHGTDYDWNNKRKNETTLPMVNLRTKVREKHVRIHKNRKRLEVQEGRYVHNKVGKIRDAVRKIRVTFLSHEFRTSDKLADKEDPDTKLWSFKGSVDGRKKWLEI